MVLCLPQHYELTCCTYGAYCCKQQSTQAIFARSPANKRPMLIDIPLFVHAHNADTGIISGRYSSLQRCVSLLMAAATDGAFIKTSHIILRPVQMEMFLQADKTNDGLQMEQIRWPLEHAPLGHGRERREPHTHGMHCTIK